MEVKMMQADLLDWPGDPGPNVHKNAKDTERQAGLRLSALQSLAAAPSGLSSTQVVRSVRAYEYSVKPRITELCRMGLAVDSGRRATNYRGRQEIVWEITPAGRELLEGIYDK
jgi:hypothetical protein